MNDAETGVAAREIRGSSVLLIGRLVSMVLNLATQVLLVRALTKGDFALFAYALAAVPLVRTIVSVGHSQALTRFLSIYEERQEYDKLFGTLVMVVGTIIAAAAVILAALFAFRGALAGLLLDDPAALSILLVMVFLGPIDALDRVAEGMFAVFSKPRAIFFRKHVIAPLLRLGVVVLLVVAGTSVLFIAVGYVLSGLLGLVLYTSLLLRLFRQRGLFQHFSFRRLVLPVREVYGFSLPLLSTELVNVSINTISVVLLARFAGTAAVADYRAVLPAARLNQFVLFTFSLLFAPLAARLFARGDLKGMREAYWQTAAWLTVLSFPVFVLTGPLARPVTVVLFGERYAGSAVVLALLACGYYVNAVLGFNALTLQTFGHLRYVLIVNLVIAALNVGLVAALAVAYGLVGVAIANAATLVVQNVLNQFGVARRVGVGAFHRAYVRPYATVAVAAAATWAFHAILDPSIPLDLAFAAAASAAVLVGNRSVLRLGDTFPEVARLPVVRRLL